MCCNRISKYFNLILSLISLAFDSHLERSLGIDALRVRIASSIVGEALVDVSTLDAVPYETLVAGALVRALGVLALGEFAAGVDV